MRRSFESTTNTKAGWRKDAECFTEALENPAMMGAWDGPTQEFAPQAKITCDDCKVRLMCIRDAAKDPAAEGMRGGFFFEGGTVTVSTNKEIFKKYGFKAPQRNRPRGQMNRETA